jgi:hypothetical protein
MRALAAAYLDEDEDIVQQLAAQILWFHNCVPPDKIADAPPREFYVR